jgi:hypothetical protein
LQLLGLLLLSLAHGFPPVALASLAAPAAAGMALASEEAFALGFFPFVDGLFFGSGELSGFWLRLADICFRWGLAVARCGPGRGRGSLSRYAQVCIQGDAKEGVKADSKVVSFCPCGGVKGVWES